MAAITETLYKGGVKRNIDSATGDIAMTTSGWIEDEKYGVYFFLDASTATAEFDTDDVYTAGSKVVRWTTTNATGRGRIIIGGTSTGATLSLPLLTKYAIPLKGSTSYRFKANVKYQNLVSTSNFLALHIHDTAGSRIATPNSGVKAGNSTGINGYEEIVITFTTGATAAYCNINFTQLEGDAQVVGLDINSMTLEEVSTINNSSSVPALFYPKATAVTSTDNIDQSQVTNTGSTAFGNNSSQRRVGQTFTPAKKNITGFIFTKNANTGSPTFDVEVSLQATTSNLPNGTIIGTPVTIAAADWDTIISGTEYTVPYLATVTPGTLYALVFTPSAQGDVSNLRNILATASDAYSGGNRIAFNGTIWSAGTGDQYFKTLYSKNTTNFTVSTDTETLSVTAPTADGWEDGEVINFPTPLTLATGVNNIYYSSNGHTDADGTVDPSLQAYGGGELYTKFYTNQTLLNLINGTVGLNQQDCLNTLAGTTGLSRQGAWNVWAGTTGLRTQDCANIKAGTSGLNIQDCLYIIAGL